MARDPDEQRIREKAYHLWIAQGRPEGRAEEHWETARELVAIEDSQRTTLRPPPTEAGEPVEPAIAFENQGEFPTLTDEGEAVPGPTRQTEVETGNALPQAPPNAPAPATSARAAPKGRAPARPTAGNAKAEPAKAGAGKGRGKGK